MKGNGKRCRLSRLVGCLGLLWREKIPTNKTLLGSSPDIDAMLEKQTAYDSARCAFLAEFGRLALCCWTTHMLVDGTALHHALAD
jgi:hypothetical protein